MRISFVAIWRGGWLAQIFCDLPNILTAFIVSNIILWVHSPIPIERDETVEKVRRTTTTATTT